LGHDVFQEMRPPYPERYRTRVAQFELQLNSLGTNPPTSLVLFGDSISEANPATRLRGLGVFNMGIGGDEAEHAEGGLHRRVHLVPRANPAEVFMLIGINDLSNNKSPELIASQISSLLETLRDMTPNACIYLQSVLPTSGEYLHLLDGVQKLNALLPAIALETGATYIDLHTAMADERGQLRPELTYDGLHLGPAGYGFWTQLIEAVE
jgi:lysophospholipase L1-like esterase